MLSASADGSVRAFDLLRYRNFRTFASPDGLCQRLGSTWFTAGSVHRSVRGANGLMKIKTVRSKNEGLNIV